MLERVSYSNSPSTLCLHLPTTIQDGRPWVTTLLNRERESLVRAYLRSLDLILAPDVWLPLSSRRIPDWAEQVSGQ